MISQSSGVAAGTSLAEDEKSQPPRSTGARSVFYSLAAKLAIVALNAGTGILTARVLHPQGRGELAALLLWPQVLSGTLTLGLPSAIMYHTRLSPRRASVLLASGLMLAVVIGTVASVIAILMAPRLLHQYSPEIVRIAQWIMPNLIVGIYLLIGRAVLEADSRFGLSGLILVGPPALTLLGLAALAVLHCLTAGNAAIIYTLSGFAPAIYLYRKLEVRYRHSWQQVLSAGRTLLSYGVRSFGIDLCGTLGYYIDQALVVSMLAPDRMGVYVVALSASRVLNVPQQALASVLFPNMVGLSPSQIAALVRRSLRIGGTVALLSMVAGALLGRILLRMLYGPDFAGVGTTLAVLTAEAALSGCVTILAQAFMASDGPGTITAQQVLGLSISIPCLLLLIPHYGVTGAALSILISTATRYLFAVVSFMRRFGGGPPSLLLNAESLRWVKSHLSRNFPIPSLSRTVPMGAQG